MPPTVWGELEKEGQQSRESGERGGGSSCTEEGLGTFGSASAENHLEGFSSKCSFSHGQSHNLLFKNYSRLHSVLVPLSPQGRGCMALRR